MTTNRNGNMRPEGTRRVEGTRHGNQHRSRKVDLLALLDAARYALDVHGEVDNARLYLKLYHRQYALAPASTRRRWRCGR